MFQQDVTLIFSLHLHFLFISSNNYYNMAYILTLWKLFQSTLAGAKLTIWSLVDPSVADEIALP